MPVLPIQEMNSRSVNIYWLRDQSSRYGFSGSSGFPVVLALQISAFRPFQLSGHSGYSSVILDLLNK
jgi:hypothetical protein